MYISLVIGFYKRLDNLNIIFDALKKQSYQNVEVIIAEDDENPDTVEFLKAIRNEVSFPVKHVCHPDFGFRKNKILNDALKIASGEYVVFIDGDCVPHKQFLYQYAKLFSPATILYGRRVMLSEKHTAYLYKIKKASGLNFLQLFINKSSLIEEGLYLPFDIYTKKKFGRIVGSNWGIDKKTLIEINGFDEDYISAGVGEDVDIEWRLLKKGVKSKSVKFKCIQYHLYHTPNYSSDQIQINYKILDNKKKSGFVECKNGIVKFG
jgi:cellulose synthase/poly-beta-1,6-N-acetylglucosamine synthase-like glycosyltransferase